MKWSGLLIEAEPHSFELALEKHRNVTLVPACLSLTTKPQLLDFYFEQKVKAKIVQESSGNSVKVQCLPLYSILLAMNQMTVDLLSLDIEGNEVDVLKTVPFDKVDIKVRYMKY